MSNNNELLAAELELLADEARLGRGVSPERACQDGRRILRRRRVLSTTGGVGATGLALVLAAFLLPTHSRGSTGGAGTGTVPGDAVTVPAGLTTGEPVVLTPPDPAARSAPAEPDTTPGSDPLNGSATFGWLPAGFSINGYNTNPGQPAGDIGPEAGTYATVYEISAQTADGDQRASLAVFPTGISPVIANQAGTVPAPPVNHKTAYWQTAPADQAPASGEVVLDWQYQPGTWAELSLDLGGAAQAQTRNTALEMAQRAEFGQTRAIPLPFKHVTIPAGLDTVTAGWTQLNPGIVADSTWEETLSFANGPNPAGGAAGGYSALQIGVTADELPAADAGFTDNTGQSQQVVHTTVDGLAATLMTSTGYTLLTIDGADGFGTVEIQGVGAEGTKLAQPGAAAAVFGRLRLLGTNQADWTTDVAH